MAGLVRDKQGKLYEDLGGGEYRILPQEEIDSLNDNPLTTFGKAAAVSAAQAWEGAKKLAGDESASSNLRQAEALQQAYSSVNPVSAFAGQVAPAVGVGVATMGAGAIPAIGAEALMGAVYAPDNPLLGATIGAATGAAPLAVGPIVRGATAALPVVSEAIQNATGVPMMGIAGGGRTGGRMADRVAQQIDAAAPEGSAPAARVLAGTNTAQELEQMGAQLAPWQRMALEATDRGQFAAAERARWTAKVAGNDFPEAMASQRYAFTDLIKRELGMEGVENLTPRMVAQGLETEGKAIGQFRQARGLTQLDDTQLSTIRQTVDEANTTHQAALKNILSDLENSAAKNDGSIAPADLNSAIRRLNNLSAPGSDPARIADAKQVLRELEAAIEKKLNPAEREMYRQAMYRYKVLKALDKPGALSADGTANPVSFGRNWDKATAQTLRGQDTLGKAADTFAAIQVIRENPGTTLQRVFAQAPAKAASLGTSAALGAAGLSAFGGLL